MADPYLVARNVAAELWTVRKNEALSREDLVARLTEPVSPRTLASREHGTRAFNLAQYVAWCDALKTSPVGALRTAMLRAALVDRCQCCGEVRGG